MSIFGNNSIICISEDWTRVVASLWHLRRRKKQSGMWMVGAAGQHHCREGPGGPGGQQGGCEPGGGLRPPAAWTAWGTEPSAGRYPRWEPALLSLVRAEDMAGKSGFSSMFSSTTETWTSRRKFSEGTGASFVQEEGERTSSVQPREVQARESSTDVWK